MPDSTGYPRDIIDEKPDLVHRTKAQPKNLPIMIGALIVVLFVLYRK